MSERNWTTASAYDGPVCFSAFPFVDLLFFKFRNSKLFSFPTPIFILQTVRNPKERSHLLMILLLAPFFPSSEKEGGGKQEKIIRNLAKCRFFRLPGRHMHPCMHFLRLGRRAHAVLWKVQHVHTPFPRIEHTLTLAAKHLFESFLGEHYRTNIQFTFKWGRTNRQLNSNCCNPSSPRRGGGGVDLSLGRSNITEIQIKQTKIYRMEKSKGII